MWKTKFFVVCKDGVKYYGTAYSGYCNQAAPPGKGPVPVDCGDSANKGEVLASDRGHS